MKFSLKVADEKYLPQALQKNLRITLLSEDLKNDPFPTTDPEFVSGLRAEMQFKLGQRRFMAQHESKTRPYSAGIHGPWDPLLASLQQDQGAVSGSKRFQVLDQILFLFAGVALGTVFVPEDPVVVTGVRHSGSPGVIKMVGPILG